MFSVDEDWEQQMKGWEPSDMGPESGLWCGFPGVQEQSQTGMHGPLPYIGSPVVGWGQLLDPLD